MINIPQSFMNVPYDGKRYPGASDTGSIAEGANCQIFAYSILRYFGAQIPDFRSSDLWEDEEYTSTVESYEPLDLALFNKTKEAWGAHVALFLSKEELIHLSEKQKYPAIWKLSDFLKLEEYRCLVGVKRLKGEYISNVE